MQSFFYSFEVTHLYFTFSFVENNVLLAASQTYVDRVGFRASHFHVSISIQSVRNGNFLFSCTVQRSCQGCQVEHSAETLGEIITFPDSVTSTLLDLIACFISSCH